MRARELAFQEISGWINAAWHELGLPSNQQQIYTLNPLATPEYDELNAIFLHCLKDVPLKRGNSTAHGFPVVQQASIVFNCWLKPPITPTPFWHVDFYEHFLHVLTSSQLSEQGSRLIITETSGPADILGIGALLFQQYAELVYINTITI